MNITNTIMTNIETDFYNANDAFEYFYKYISKYIRSYNIIYL